MKNLLKSIFVIIALISLSGCSSTKKIQNNMNSKSLSMAYLMDSKIAGSKSSISLSIDTVLFNNNLMSDTTKVIRDKGWFLPLIFVYVWNSHNTCVQGRSMMEEDIPGFLRTALISEINRSGNFNADTLSHSEYSLELSVDEIETTGPYNCSGYFYFAIYVYGYSYGDRAGPAVSHLKVSYKLKKAGEVIYSNSFSSERFTEQINKRYTNVNLLQQDYAVSMVEAVSFNFKYIIEMMVNDLNSYFAGTTL